MKLLLHILLYSLSVLFINCGHSAIENQEIEHYDLSVYKSGKLDDIFSEVSLVPLEYSGKNYPTETYRLTANDSIVMVTDNHMTSHIFSPDGRYISCSSEKQGEGPEEFPFSMETTWNIHNNTIEIITPFKLMSYDKYFNYVKETKLPTYIGNATKESFLFYYIHSLSDSIHLVRLSTDGYSLVEYNSNTNKLGDKISFGNDVIIGFNFQSNKFFNIQDNITYCIPGPMTNRIYSFDAGKMTITPIIEFGTGPNGLTKQYLDNLNMAPEDLAYYILSCDHNMLLNTLPNQNYFITMLRDGDKHIKSLYYVFVNRTTGDKFRINMYEGDRANMPMFKDIDNEYAYATVLKEELEEMPWLLLDKEEKSDSIFGSIEDESLILLKYRFR